MEVKDCENLLKENKRKGLNCYRKVLAENPMDAQLLMKYGDALLQFQEFKEAAEVFEKITRTEDFNKTAYLKWGKALQNLNRDTEAVYCLKKALKFDPTYEEVYLDLKNMLNKSGLCNSDEIIEKFRQAVHSDKKSSIQKHWGNVFYCISAFQDAVKFYKKALKHTPEDSNILYNYGLGLLQTGETKEAISKLEKAVYSNSANYQALMELGHVFYRMGEYEKAIDKYKKITELLLPADDYKKNYINALSSWGSALIEIGKYDEAIPLFQEALSEDPSHAESLIGIGLCYHNKFEYDKASRAYKQTILCLEKNNQTEDYNYAFGFLNYAIILEWFGKSRKALSFYKKAYNIQPEDARFLTPYGKYLGYIGRQPEALKVFDHGFELFQKGVLKNIDPNFWNEYGLLVAESGEISSAVYSIFKYGDESDSNYLVKHNLAYYHYKLGNYEKSREYWGKALKSFLILIKADGNANNPDLWNRPVFNNYYLYLNAATIHHKTWGDFSLAEKIFEQVRSLIPDDLLVTISLSDLYLDKFQLAVEPEKEDYWNAKGYLDKARSLNQQNKLISYQIAFARLLIKHEEFAEAEKLLKSLLNNEVKDIQYNYLFYKRDRAELHSLLGFIILYKSDTSAESKTTSCNACIEYFRKASEIDPANINYMVFKAKALSIFDKPDQAEQEYKRLLQIDQNNVDVYTGLGEVYLSNADKKQDAEAYEQADRFFDQAILLGTGIGGSKLLDSRPGGANKWGVKEIRSYKNKELANLYYLKGYIKAKIYENNGLKVSTRQLSDSLQCFEKCLEHNPGHIKAERARIKLKSKLNATKGERWAEKFAAWVVIPVMLIILGIFVASFIKYNFLPSGYSLSPGASMLINSLSGLNDQQKEQVSKLQNVVFKSKAGIKETLKNIVGKDTYEEHKSTLSEIDYTVHEKSAADLPFTGIIFAVFGSIVLIIVGFYLPKIIRLKVGAIELEKETVTLSQETLLLNEENLQSNRGK